MAKPYSFRQVLELLSYSSSTQTVVGLSDLKEFQDTAATLRMVDISNTGDYREIKSKANAALYASGSPIRFGAPAPSKFNPSTGIWDPQGLWFGFVICVPSAVDPKDPGNVVESSGRFQMGQDIIDCKFAVYIVPIF